MLPYALDYLLWTLTNIFNHGTYTTWRSKKVNYCSHYLPELLPEIAMRETVLDNLLLKKIIFFFFEALKFITTKKRFVIFDLCVIIFSHPLCSLLSVCLLSTLHLNIVPF